MVFTLLAGLCPIFKIFTFPQGLLSPGLHFLSKWGGGSSQYLTIARILVPNGLVLVFIKMLIWDPHVYNSL